MIAGHITHKKLGENHLNEMFKTCVFSLPLKLSKVIAARTDSGRLFQTLGPATEKARSPNLVLVRGTIHVVRTGGETKTLTSWLASDRRDGLSRVQRAVVAMNREHKQHYFVLDQMDDR